MEKIRIYQLAKELNTTSKRLIEKLEEIKIDVKNHMSLLNEDQLKALYDHIGVITHKEEPETEKGKMPRPPRPEPAKRPVRKQDRSRPTIIRKTEVNLDSDDEDYRSGGKSKRRPQKKRRRDYVKVADDTSGLRAGFVREKRDSLKDFKKTSSKKAKKEDEEKKKQKEKAAAVPREKEKEKSAAKQQVKGNEKIEKKEPVTAKEQKEPQMIKPVEKKRKPARKKEQEKKPAAKKTGEEQSGPAASGRKAETKTVKTAAGSKPINKPGPDREAVKDEKDMPRKDKKTVKKSRPYSGKPRTKEPQKASPAAGKKRKFNTQNIVLGGKKDVSEVMSEGFEFEEYIPKYGKKKKAPRARKGLRMKAGPEDAKPTRKSVKIPDTLTVKSLAGKLKKSSTEVIKKLMGLGMMVTLNEEIDFESASIIADEFGIKIEKEIVISEEDILFDDTNDDDGKDTEDRAPVVVVMGHVDHGKTSLLDAIREENVLDTEAGGITQHIGAYTVTINGRRITFLDTPGHEAFTSLRARGAQVTDIAILVVAADDGVMPQTVEAINHAKAAGVSIVVAINKIDLPGANPDRVRQQLTEHGLVPEEWGGDVICIGVSAKNRENIDGLLEMVLLTADMLELKTNPKKQAKGTVIEARLDKTRGAIATLLVQRGTLGHGDSIVTGTTVGRIRAMMDDKGKDMEKAGPSTPVEILGLPEVPKAGEVFYAITDEKVARQLAEKRRENQRQEQIKTTSKVSLDDLYNQIREGSMKELNVIVKADVQGSVEAVKQAFEKIENEEVQVRIIHGGVGAVNESDVNLAEVTNAIIIGFNVRPGANVMELAENAEVDVRLYRVIYEAIEDIEAAMKGMLEPSYREAVLGHAEIRQIFRVPGAGTVAGCYVTDGKISRNSSVRLVRDGVVVHEGSLESLKRFKDDAKEVVQGYECGVSIEKFNDIKEGDVIEAYVMEEVER